MDIQAIFRDIDTNEADGAGVRLERVGTAAAQGSAAADRVSVLK